MTPFLIIAIISTLASVLYFVRPLLKDTSKGKLEPIFWSALVIVCTSLIFYKIGNTEALSKQIPDSENVEQALQTARENPNNVTDWNALARSYEYEQKFIHAYMAYSEAKQINEFIPLDESNKQDKLDWITGLAESRILARKGALDETSIGFIEQAAQIDSLNPTVLLYGGFAALQRQDIALAKSRWQQLLTQNPPETLKRVIEDRLDRLWELKLRINLDDELRSKSADSSRVFVSLRQGDNRPPFAAKNLILEELSDLVIISSQDGIAQMANNAQVDWAQAVNLTLTWAPDGNAVSEKNVRLSYPIKREQFDTIQELTLTFPD